MLASLASFLGLVAAAGLQPAAPDLPRVDPPPLGPTSGENPEHHLQPVVFPEDGRPAKPTTAPRHRRLRATVIDLRDPFVRPTGLRRHTRGSQARLLLPDLKDPFRATARVQPKNWKVPRVPGDIRDPFAPALRERSLQHGCPEATTPDGVVIQRPSQLRNGGSDTRAEGSGDGCARVVPQDLRDPFAKR